MFVHWFRKRVGWFLYLAGIALLAYEIYLWRQDGRWNRYPIALMVEQFAHTVAVVMEKIPGAQAEGVEMWSRFDISDLPHYVERFFKVIPMSGLFLVFGYFGIRWDKYLGHHR